MKTLYGLTNMQVYETSDVDELNQFLLEYDGNIIDIQFNNEKYVVIYRYRD
jgi:hypothetical protein